MIYAGNLIACLMVLASDPLVSGLCSTCLEGRCYDNGECIIGCVPGYVGRYCVQDCPSRCMNKVCHLARSDGTVTCTYGCEPGYCDINCELPCPGGCVTCDRQCGSCNVNICPERRYGADCSRVCSPRYEKCDRETGQCIRCRRGYYGDECNQECTTCFTRAETIRDTCLSGCDICKSKETCRTGFYGDSCELKCSTGCDNTGGCNRATGECSAGCVSGYHGLACNYTCSEHCLSGRCNRETGECSAGCVSGYHVLACNYMCSEHCLSGRCNRATGECFAGCVSGYHGPTCKTADEMDSAKGGYLEIIVVVVTILLLLTVITVFLVVFRKRWSLRCKGREQESMELQEMLMPTDIDEMVKKQILNLRKSTQHRIESLTSGMIHVSAVDTVVDMLQSGRNWVTITGNAGDGKTTLGYLVLNKLRGKINVYSIEDPEEYRLLLRLNEDRVIMFDDRFGAFISDQILIDKWKAVVNDIHKQFTLDGNQTKVIFISRKNVVNEARVFLGQLQGTILYPDNVVDLSQVKIKDERLEILDYYLKQGKLKVSSEVRQRVADLDIAHGFPHCSMMYPKLKAKKHDLDIEEFFKTPLKFLDITTSVLYNENCKDLFELMIMNNGQFDAYSLDDHASRSSLLKVELEQEGSYITVWENGVCVFAHPSIYESVLSVICNTDPLFCVKYATLSVIRQKLILTSDENRKSPTQISVKPVEPVLKALAERFRPEILQGGYSVFRHRFCENEVFCKELVASCVFADLAAPQQNGSKQFINRPGEDGETMLWTALKSGNMTAVQVFVKAGADVNTQDERGRTPLHFLLELPHSTAADDEQHRMVIDTVRVIITEGKGDVNICDQYGQTPLHFLGRVTPDDCDDDDDSVDMDTMRMIITEGKGDVNTCDQYGHTPLHYLFNERSMTSDDITWIITDGKGDLNKCERNKSTPLHYMCAYSGLQLNTVDLVIREGKGDFNKGDEHGSTPLHYLCDNVNIDIDVVRRIVHTAKGDINMQDANGITSLHFICMRALEIKDILTLIRQGDNTDIYGNTPLHFLCRRREINVDELEQQLKQIPETDMKKQNSLGYTPIDYLNDQDDILRWTDGVIQRSVVDLVLCSFEHGDRKIVVLGRAMALNSERVHEDLQVGDFNHELNNMAVSGHIDRLGQFTVFKGTCSTPVALLPLPFHFSQTEYWETHSRHTLKERVAWPLLDIGVVEGERNLNEKLWLSDHPGSFSVAIQDFCPRHNDLLCIKVWRTDQEGRKQQVGDCVTLPLPTSCEEITLKFGLVLDVGRGRVGFIDVERGEILGKVDQKFTERVFPMFSLSPCSCTTRMRLVSGREISRNDRKIQLIQQVLLD